MEISNMREETYRACSCYQSVLGKVLQKEPTAMANAHIEFRVAAGGTVDQVNLSTAYSDFDSCMKRAGSRWRFDAPKDKKLGKPTNVRFVVSVQLGNR